MIFADPPYFLSNGGFSVHAGERVSVDKGDWDKPDPFGHNVEFHKKWISLCRTILKQNGTIWISGTHHSIYTCGYLLQKLNFDIINEIIWYKPNAPPNLSCRYFTHSHETIIWAANSRSSDHIFNYEDMKYRPFPEDKLKKPQKQMRSVWYIPTTPQSEKQQGKHPTQKPLALLNRILLSSTNENDLVLDPFTGSSTTGIAAHKHDRGFIGIDSNQEFLDISIKRFKNQKEKDKQMGLNDF